MSIVDDFKAINKQLEPKKKQKCWYCAGKGLVPDMSDPLKTNFCHLCGGSGLAAEDLPAAQPTQGNACPIPAELFQLKVEDWGGSEMVIIEVLGSTERWGIRPGGLCKIEDFLNWLKQASGR